MKKLWLLVAGLAMVIAVVGLAGCVQVAAPVNGTPSNINVNLNSQQEGIWVNGNGEVTAVPDVATLSLGIESQEATVAEAQSRAAGAMDKVMKALTGNGVAEKDIQTQYFNISRVTRWDNENLREVVIGYRVTNTVTAKIRELDRTGAVIDAVALAGGDLTRIDSIGFSVDDPSPYLAEARVKAVADASSKAEKMAELTGVALGKPTYISENSYLPGPIYRQDMIAKAEAAPAMETPINPGEMKISLNVQITYAILD